MLRAIVILVLAADPRLAGILWALTTDCSSAGNELHRRQCEGIKAARAPRGKVTLRGDAAALELISFKDGVLTYAVHGCLACAAPVQGLHVVTTGSVRVSDGKVIGPTLATATRGGFGSRAAAEAWLSASKVLISFTVPPKLVAWSEAGKSGVFVDLASFTVEGTAAPASAPATTEELPDQLSFEQINEALGAQKPRVQVCFERYGVPGTADVYLELDSGGAVKYVEVRGTYADTPTGECVAAAVNEARFPAFRRGTMRVNYSYLLR